MRLVDAILWKLCCIAVLILLLFGTSRAQTVLKNSDGIVRCPINNEQNDSKRICFNDRKCVNREIIMYYGRLMYVYI